MRRETHNAHGDLGAAAAGLSAVSGAAALVSSSLGGGFLSLPFAYYKAGIVGGLILQLVLCVASGWTVHLLATTSEAASAHTYRELARASLGHYGEWCVLCCVVGVTYMGGIGYLMLMASIARDLTNGAAPTFVFVIAEGLAASPFCLLDSMESLNSASRLAVLAFASLAISIFVSSCREPWEGVKLLPSSFFDVVYAFPFFGIAFSCHFNAIPAYVELRSRKDLTKTVLLESIVCFCLYAISGPFGYLYAGDAIKDDILSNFPRDDPLIIAARVGLFIALFFSYPLLNLPCRNAILELSCTNVESDSELTAPLVGDESRDAATALRSKRIKYAIVCALVTTQIACATLVPSVSYVWSITGSSFSMIVTFVLPLSVALAQTNAENHSRRYALVSLLVLACTATVLSTYVAVMDF